MRFPFSALLALLAVSAPLAGHATPITPTQTYNYTFVLTPNANNPYGGWAKLTTNTQIPNNSSITTLTGDIVSLVFVVDYKGVLESFTVANPLSTVFQVKNGQVWDITSSTTIGTGTNAFTMSTTASYVFYYYSGTPLRSTADYGTFTGLAVSPEPSSGLLVATAGILGCIGFGWQQRRRAM